MNCNEDIKEMRQFSVLMTIYYNENPKHAEEALESLLKQTLMPEEIIIIKDGLLTKDLDLLLLKYKNKFPNLFKIYGYLKNKGQGFAANWGLKKCCNNLVARMDFDDISKPDRFEKQIEFMVTNRDIAVLGTCLEEFENDIKNITSLKILPETHEELVKFSKKRSPFSQPTVILRKDKVLKSGGYWGSIKEDYNLWVRMFLKGYRGHNLQESLLYYRVGKDFYKKKGGFKHVKEEIKLQLSFFKWNHLNFLEMFRNLVVNLIFRLIPSNLRKIVYAKMLRN